MSIRVTEPTVKHGDLVTEACAEATHKLRSQCDLWNEDDGSSAPLQAGLHGVKVDLGLP